MPPGQHLSGPVSGRGDLIARLAAALVIDEGRRSGDPETRVALDHRLPDPGRDDPSPRARWRLATSSARLYPPPVARKPLSVWHSADGATLKLLGFRRGRRADGYDGDYYVVET